MNADKAPDLDREPFLRPDLEMRWASVTPRQVRMMSVGGIVGIAEIRGDA